jgi:hypothetical protein
MWRSCPQVLDAPVKILGLEPEDFAVAASMPMCTASFLDTIPSFATGVAVGLALYFTKRGRPSGALLHLLHGLQLIRLPGMLSPKPARYSPW